MFIRCISVTFNFILGVTYYKIGWKKNNPRLYYCGKSFFDRETCRSSNNSKKDSLITLRLYKDAVVKLFKNQQSFHPCNEKKRSSLAIFDGSFAGEKQRLKYVEHFSGVKADIFVSKNDILQYRGVLLTLYSLLILALSFLPVFVLSLCSRNKLRFAMIVNGHIECLYLLDTLVKNKIGTLVYFCIYELDANMCSYVLMKNGISVNKVPSEVPLVFFNQVIVANHLSLCLPYQYAEMETFKETMFVSSTSMWAPEQILEAPQRFLNSEDNSLTARFDIGFFSSGNWIREEMGNVSLGRDERINEEKLLNFLVIYTKKNNLSLRVFLHPNEKSPQNLLLSDNYYSKITSQNENVSIAEVQNPSIEGFDDINIGIALYSTLMFERIFLGLKTILVPWGYPEFPLPGSTFRNICARNESELATLIEKSLPLETSTFFKENKLKTNS